GNDAVTSAEGIVDVDTAVGEGGRKSRVAGHECGVVDNLIGVGDVVVPVVTRVRLVGEGHVALVVDLVVEPADEGDVVVDGHDTILPSRPSVVFRGRRE